MFQSFTLVAGVFLFVCCIDSGSLDKTEINPEFDRVFYGSFECDLPDTPKSTDNGNIITELQTKLNELKVVDNENGAGDKIEIELTPTHVDILKYKLQIDDESRARVTFRLTFAKYKINNEIKYSVTRQLLEKALKLKLKSKNPKHQPNIYIFAVDDPEDRAASSKKKDADYKLAEENILRYMNLSAQPCTDFYEYACGNYEAGYAQVKHKFVKSHSSFVIKQFFVSEVEDSEPRYKKVARQFYAECNDFFDATEAEREMKTKRYINGVLTKLGGLPLTDANWNEANASTSLTDLIAQLQIKHNSFAGFIHFFPAVNQNNEQPDDKKHALAVQETLGMLPTLDQIEHAISKYVRIDNVADQMFELKMLVNILSLIRTQLMQLIREKGIFFLSEPKKVVVSDQMAEFYVKFSASKLITSYQKVLKTETDITYDFKHFIVETDVETNILNDIYLETYKNYSSLFSERNLRNLYLTSFIAKIDSDVNNGIKNGEADVSEVCSVNFERKMHFVADRIYIDQYYAKDSLIAERKETIITQMFENVKKAYVTMFENNWWLDEESKTRMKEKIIKIKGIMAYESSLFNDDYFYFEQIHEYATYFELCDQVQLWRNLEHFQQTIEYDEDRREIFQTMMTRFYNARFMMDHVVLLNAGILNEPLYEHDAVIKATLYGSAGALIGHEIGHSLYPAFYLDHNGKWNKQHFNQREQNKIDEMHDCIVNQYNNFCPLEPEDDGQFKCVNGKLTISENVPDTLSVYTSLKALKDLNLAPKRFSGLLADKSPEEIFFLAYAQNWCDNPKSKEQWAVELGHFGVHSPNKFRVNGAVQNNPAFAEAFNCPKEDKMAPAIPCKIWT